MKIKHIHRIFPLLLLALAGFTVLVAPTALAEGCAGADTAIIKCTETGAEGDLQQNGIWAILLIVIRIMTAGVGVAAVGGLAYAALLWTTAGGNSSQIAKSKQTMFNVVIGIVSFSLMWSLLQFLVPGGVFETDDSSTTKNSASKSSKNGASDPTDDSDDRDDKSDASGGGSKKNTPTIDDIRLPNTRDASTSTGGNVLKKGMLFRSMSLAGLRDRDAIKLGKIMGDNGTIIDLREAGQRSGKLDKDVPGVRNTSVPIGGILDTAPMVTDPARRDDLATALKVAANANGPILIHCAAGKDRTGWMVAMIMSTAGATDAQIMKEYMKSNDEPIDGGVKAQWLNSGLQEAKSKHGSIAGYLKSIGLSNADLNNLKNKYGN